MGFFDTYTPVRWVLRPEDTEQVRFQKRTLTCFCIVGIGLGIGMRANNHRMDNVGGMQGLCGMVGALALAVQFLYEKKVREEFVEFAVYTATVGTILTDYNQVVLGSRWWVTVVVLVDVCLVLRLKNRVSYNVIALISTWHLVVCVESAFRFGIFDASYLPNQEARREVHDCDALPCAVKWGGAFNIFLGSVAIFVLDFYFTRGFAQRMFLEHDRMEAAIATAENIAEALSRFDLDGANCTLKTATTLPPALSTAFSDILINLRLYRPYLPDVLFDELHNRGQHQHQEPEESIRHLSLTQSHHMEAPGLHTKHATLVFTDIQASTATWEACPEAMRRALTIHNHVMRHCFGSFGGYEVKTIGDAFMIAFSSTIDAIAFSLSVQERLLSSKWPSGLLKLEHCAQRADGPWCGLRVRIGVHCGEVNVQQNTLTGRYDYFGKVVNKAARLEEICVGGAVAVSEEVMDIVGDMGSVCVIPMGETRLREENVCMPYMLLPIMLRGRRLYIESQLQLGRDDRRPVVSPFNHAHPVAVEEEEDVMRKAGLATVGDVGVVVPLEECEGVTRVMDLMLAKVLLAVERSHGVVVVLHGSRVSVGWNTSRKCPTHVENSFAFVNMFHSAMEPFAAVHVGIATSEVFHGTVGRGDRRFVTVLGNGVDLSRSLCTSCFEDEVYCLYGTPAVATQTEGLRLQKISIMEAPGYHRFVNVYQVTVVGQTMRGDTPA